MSDLIVALGLALAIEGILFAAFPDAVKRAMQDAAQTRCDRMRIVGSGSAVIGVVIVWVVRGLRL